MFSIRQSSIRQRTTRQRTTGALLSVATLLFGFAQAPFFHVHRDVHGEELQHEHGAGLAHMHLRLADEADEGVHIEARTADDDAVDVVWSVSSPSGHAFHFDLDSVGLASM